MKSKEETVNKTKKTKKQKENEINLLPKYSPGEVLRRNVLQAKHLGEV